jgi:hypothetical protein
VWISELTTNTKTADTKIGRASATKPVITASWGEVRAG